MPLTKAKKEQKKKVVMGNWKIYKSLKICLYKILYSDKRKKNSQKKKKEIIQSINQINRASSCCAP